MPEGHWIIAFALTLALAVTGCADMQMSGDTTATADFGNDDGGDGSGY